MNLDLIARYSGVAPVTVQGSAQAVGCQVLVNSCDTLPGTLQTEPTEWSEYPSSVFEMFSGGPSGGVQKSNRLAKRPWAFYLSYEI